MKMKAGILAVSLLMLTGILSSQRGGKKDSQEQTEQMNQVAEYRAKSRENLKPHRYDGTKITYFNYQIYDQNKEVEILLFNGIDYKFCFNTDGVPKGIDIAIYDAKKGASGRILLSEQNGVSQRDVTIFSKDLLTKLQETKSSVTSLKRIYIDYNIPVGNQKVEAKPLNNEPEKRKLRAEEPAPSVEKGVVVLSYGYKNS